MAALLVACSNEQIQPAPTPGQVMIHGLVKFHASGCASDAASMLEGRQISVRDKHGRLIGVSKTPKGAGACIQSGRHSLITNSFQVNAVLANIYRIQLDDVPGDRALSNAATCSRVTYSAQDLQTVNGQLDLDAGFYYFDPVGGDVDAGC